VIQVPTPGWLRRAQPSSDGGEVAVERCLEGVSGELSPQSPRDVQLTRKDDRARVGAPPQDRLARLEPRKYPEPVGRQQALG
jgi:hypothetical protein